MHREEGCWVQREHFFQSLRIIVNKIISVWCVWGQQQDPSVCVEGQSQVYKVFWKFRLLGTELALVDNMELLSSVLLWGAAVLLAFSASGGLPVIKTTQLCTFASWRTEGPYKDLKHGCSLFLNTPSANCWINRKFAVAKKTCPFVVAATWSKQLVF